MLFYLVFYIIAKLFFVSRWMGWYMGDGRYNQGGRGGGGFNVILYGHDRGVLTRLPGPVHGVMSTIGVLNAYKRKEYN